MNAFRSYFVLGGVDPFGLATAGNVSQCIVRCEDDCGRRYWPSPWNPWFVGCIAGCKSGCHGEEFNLESYIDYSMSDDYKAKLTCICGAVEVGDVILPPFAPIAVLDCACEVFTSIANHGTDRHTAGSQLMPIIHATDCYLDLISLGGRFPRNVTEIWDRMLVLIEEGNMWGRPDQDCSARGA